MLGLDSPELHKLVQPLRRPDNTTNWVYLAIDYASLIVVLGGAIAFCQMHQEWGFSSLWLLPVILTAVCLVGALQHRLAGLGHLHTRGNAVGADRQREHGRQTCGRQTCR